MKKPIFRHLVVGTLIALSASAALVLAPQVSRSAADRTRRIDTEAERRPPPGGDRKVRLTGPDSVGDDDANLMRRLQRDKLVRSHK